MRASRISFLPQPPHDEQRVSSCDHSIAVAAKPWAAAPLVVKVLPAAAAGLVSRGLRTHHRLAWQHGDDDLAPPASIPRNASRHVVLGIGVLLRLARRKSGFLSSRNCAGPIARRAEPAARHAPTPSRPR